MADDYCGLDVLSSQMDVKTSNFRRVPALPIYGCAQPSSQVCIEHSIVIDQHHTNPVQPPLASGAAEDLIQDRGPCMEMYP